MRTFSSKFDNWSAGNASQARRAFFEENEVVQRQSTTRAAGLGMTRAPHVFDDYADVNLDHYDVEDRTSTRTGTEKLRAAASQIRMGR